MQHSTKIDWLIVNMYRLKLNIYTYAKLYALYSAVGQVPQI